MLELIDKTLNKEMMKRLYVIICVAIVMGFVLCGCSGDEPNPTPNPGTGTGTGGTGGGSGGGTSDTEAKLSISPSGDIDIPVEGGSVTVTVTTNESSWDAKFTSAKPDWCSISKDVAKKTFTVSGDANTSSVARTPAKITVSGVKAPSLSVTVNQKGAEPTLTVEPNVLSIEFNANSKGQEFAYEVITNVTEWEINVMGGTSSWCKVSVDKAKKTFTITAEPNQSEVRRDDTVFIKYIGVGDVPHLLSITVSQKAKITSGGLGNYDYDDGFDWDGDE